MSKSAVVIAVLFLVAVGVTRTGSWLLAQVGLNETYTVKHLCTHQTRVFLSIAVASRTFSTLIEAQWPRSAYAPRRTRIYPHRLAHANGKHTDCTRLHQAVWSEVDSLSRLWVLDIGWQEGAIYCPPKLLVYDLIKNNVEVLRINCGKFIEPVESKLLLVKLGPQFAACQVERFIYFVLAGDASPLLAYDILEQNWHRPHLISQKYYPNVPDHFPVAVQDLAFGINHELIVADVDGVLYRTRRPFNNADDLYNDTTNTILAVGNTYEYAVEMVRQGGLLGPSKGLMVDSVGVLFYAVPKYGAVVRCLNSANITAEDNEIIYLTPKNIQQIFFGTTGSVWLLTERTLRPDDNCLSGE